MQVVRIAFPTSKKQEEKDLRDKKFWIRCHQQKAGDDRKIELCL